MVPGTILSLSTQCIRQLKQVKVLALCSEQEGKTHDGSLLTVLSLPARDLAGTVLTDSLLILFSHFGNSSEVFFSTG